MIGLFEFELALPEMLLTAGNINHNLNIIKLYLACAKQAAAVMTANDVCSILTVSLTDTIWSSLTTSSWFVIYFEQVH